MLRQLLFSDIIRLSDASVREEVSAILQYILSFLLAVLAGVAIHIIVKWLDSRKK